MLDFLVFVKQHKLVKYILWIERNFSSYCLTVRPPQFVSAQGPKYRNPPLCLMHVVQSAVFIYLSVCNVEAPWSCGLGYFEYSYMKGN